MYTLSLYLTVLLVTVLVKQSHSKSLPLCGRTEINHGRWENSSAPYNVTWSHHQFLDYFVHGGPGEALNFTQVWLPYGCSYHRWNNHTFQSCAKHVQLKRNESSHERLRIAFIGDSGTRGVFNGLSRMLSGSELYGPCSNVVCGDPGLPISYRNHLQIFRVPFPPAVELIFMYFKSMTHDNGIAAIKKVLQLKPYVTIFNSGAWDFDDLSRKYNRRVPIERCDNDEYEEISKMRASPDIRSKMLDIAAFAKEMGSKLIYRTNHYNVRYGANCADDRFLDMIRTDDVLRESWEIWDNFNTSRDSWLEQTYDGFHFDRNRVHSVQHAKAHMNFCVSKGWMVPGQLETTLVQTLLHQVFHDCAKHYYKLHRRDRDEVNPSG